MMNGLLGFLSPLARLCRLASPRTSNLSPLSRKATLSPLQIKEFVGIFLLSHDWFLTTPILGHFRPL